jgi:hypothetical protein
MRTPMQRFSYSTMGMGFLLISLWVSVASAQVCSVALRHANGTAVGTGSMTLTVQTAPGKNYQKIVIAPGVWVEAAIVDFGNGVCPHKREGQEWRLYHRGSTSMGLQPGDKLTINLSTPSRICWVYTDVWYTCLQGVGAASYVADGPAIIPEYAEHHVWWEYELYGSGIKIWPPGRDSACVDSAKIYQVKQSDPVLNPCCPADGDRVLGLSGIITAFRYRSTGCIYIENSNGDPFNGLRVHTPSAHLEALGFALGDSIAVSGLKESYQSSTQIQGVLGASLTVRKISAGNVLPPFRLGTTSDYKWNPATGAGSAFETCNPTEGMLVRVNGPLKVARVAAGAGLSAGINWLLVNADGSFPGDSILIDGYTLPALNILAPPVGALVDGVQGVLRRATNNGVDCWLISLRNANDQQAATFPNLVEAYPIAENKLRLTFDKNVDVTSAEIAGNYTLGSAIMESSVDDAEVLGGSGSAVDLTITDMLPRLSLESITSENIYSATCLLPTCASPQQSLEFVLGVLTCAEVQAPQPDSLVGEPCLDKSVFAGGGSAFGARLTVRGVALQTYGTLSYIGDAGGGLRSGVSVDNSPVPLTPGRQYLIPSRVREGSTETELTDILGVGILDEGPVPVPSPLIRTVNELRDVGCDPSQSTLNAEDFEGVLVRVAGVVVPSDTSQGALLPGAPFPVVPLNNPGLDTILVSRLGNTYPAFAVLDGMFLNVNGVLHMDAGVPCLLPRSGSDIELLGVLGVEPKDLGALSLSVMPNPGTSQRVSFVLPQKSQVQLGVYDLLGRRVAILATGELSAGRHDRSWDGKTTGGEPAPAGIYFYRLVAGQGVRSTRAVKVN